MSEQTILILSQTAFYAGFLFQAIHLVHVVDRIALLYTDPHAAAKKPFNWTWLWLSMVLMSVSIILAYKIQLT